MLSLRMMFNRSRLSRKERPFIGTFSPVAFADNGVRNPVFPSISSPGAYTHAGVTYVVWLGASFNTYIASYTHASRTWSAPALVRADPGSMDDHSTASVIVDDSGYIHVFFGGNSSANIPIYHSVSTNPLDVSAWSAASNISSSTSYHAMAKTNAGTIYLFFRKALGGGVFDHRWSSSADSYASENSFLLTTGSGGDALYPGNIAYDAANGKLWYGFTYHVAGGTLKRLDIYVVYLNLADGHIYGYDDFDLGVTADHDEYLAHGRLLNSGSDEVNSPNIHLASDGTPHVMFNHNVAGTWQHRYTYLSGGSWATIETVAESNLKFHIPDFVVNADGSIEAYLPNNPLGVSGGNIDHWHRSVGGSWSLVRRIFDITDAAYEGVVYLQVASGEVDNGFRLLFSDTQLVGAASDLKLYATRADDSYLE